MTRSLTAGGGGPVALTPSERAERGKAARSSVRRSEQARFEPGPDRPDPVGILLEQEAARVPELVPIRRARMLESPFRFYRGAAAVMAHDLGTAPHTGLEVQLCGDAHVLNFGLFASPERSLVFDVNDFDETHPGPFEWDVKRLAASLAAAGRDNGFDAAERAAVVLDAVRAYRLRMQGFSGMRVLDVWYARDDSADLRAMAAQGGGALLARADKVFAKARSRDHLRAFSKLTHRVDGRLRIAPDPPLVVPLAELLDGAGPTDLDTGLRRLVDTYAQSLAPELRALVGRFRVVDMARKVVGVGSVGTRCWIFLLLGRDESDPLLLQAKEAGPSVLAPYTAPSAYDNQGQRVVAGQRLMQAAGDIFLGWERLTGLDGRERDFYVRQLLDWKGSATTEGMSPQGMRLLARVCGRSLARAHARSGDPIAIASYLGAADTFDRAVADFAESYADQNERDFAALADAARTGRVTAAGG
ncbi:MULTISPECIES: DUF2252 domain-containing protein [Streptomyces]|uniref:DUF2252 domain-containing protein n=1 Tax=Streptomyces TaxID=1883 RepID=UPI0016722928|nr:MULTISPECIES: DUF2252 domain-containing protein [Streptomyces]MBD3578147.1 DUF2252 domain-containing protein [Streptomyces sp. KD18]GGT29401.1 hypothetical protein GCM10010286_63370 [Streptomyces toxytricini]